VSDQLVYYAVRCGDVLRCVRSRTALAAAVRAVLNTLRDCDAGRIDPPRFSVIVECQPFDGTCSDCVILETEAVLQAAGLTRLGHEPKPTVEEERLP
jgi:hypothetical protein